MTRGHAEDYGALKWALDTPAEFIGVLGSKPSNICFGGPDGRTAYVTEVEHTRIVSFRVGRPGLAWRRWQEATDNQ